MTARWVTIGELDNLSIEDVADWHDLLVARDEAQAEATKTK